MNILRPMLRPTKSPASIWLSCALLLGSLLSARAQAEAAPANAQYAQSWAAADAPQAFGAFRVWTEQYATAQAGNQAALKATGIELARQRREALLALAKTNAAQVIALAVPDAVRAQLPAEVAAEVETPVSGVGDLNVLCSFPALGLQVPQKGLHSKASLNGKNYDAYTYGRRKNLTSKHGVPLHGVAIGDVLVLHESPVRELTAQDALAANQPVIAIGAASGTPVRAEIGGSIYSFGSEADLAQLKERLEAAETGFGPEAKESVSAVMAAVAGGNLAAPVAQANSASAYTTGAKNMLVIRVDFSDVPGEPHSRGSNPTVYTSAYVKNLADTQITPYYQASSYGQTTIATTVSTKLYRMPQTAAFYAVPGADDLLHSDARALASADFTLSNYDRICVLFSPLEGIAGSQINYGGLAQVGGPYWWVNGEWDFRVTVHELGHTYGLFHGNLWQVNNGYAANLAGTSVAYGDDFETMGANFANSFSTDFNPWFKNMLDWIPITKVITVTTNGTYRINRFDNSPGTSPLALRVAKDGTRNYWIGCKRSFTNNPTMSTGAYVIWGYNLNKESDLLDMVTPNSNVSDAALPIGSSFVDTDANIVITPVAAGGTGVNQYLDVQITLGSNTNLVLMSAADSSVTEGNTNTVNMVFNVGLSKAAVAPVTVNYSVAGGTATIGVDFLNTNGTLTFNPGETNKTVTVKVVGDKVIEQNETFTLQLSNVSANALLVQSSATGTIIDDDLIGAVDLVVFPSTNALVLANTLIDTNSGFIIKGVNLQANRSGTNFSSGTYQLLGASPHTYGLTKPGIVLSTGSVKDYETGPNLINGLTTSYGVAATPAQELLLDTITGGSYDHNDVSQLDILFDVAPGYNVVTFQVVFGSEEYPDFVGSPFVDGFGIFLNGTNIAFQAGLPINIDHPSFAPVLGTELNAVMAPNGKPVLTFTALVQSNSVNNVLTFIVADTSDDLLDTTVYVSSLAANLPPPVPIITIADAAPVVEGNTMTNVTFNVQLSLVSTQTVTVAYFAANGKAKRGEDFVNTAGYLTFPPGVTNQTITVPIIGDLINEPDESFSMVIYSATNGIVGRSQAFATIIDDDPQNAKLSVSDGTITEGDSGTRDFIFNIRLSEPSGYPVTLNYGTLPGSATVGLDYLPQSGTLAFEPGETNRQVVVKIVGDTIYENTENFFLNISGAIYATIIDNQGEATILDNDPIPAVSVADTSVVEGDEGVTAMVFRLSLSNPSSLAVTVDYATADGTATVADGDYTAKTGTVTFSPGQTSATVTVDITGELMEEANETLLLNLSNPVNAGAGIMTAVGTILNDDGPHLSIASASVVEGAAGTTTNAVFVVSLIKPNANTVTVDYEVIPGSATAGVDYQPITGTLSFPSGVTTQNITVVVNGDSVIETNETFTVRLENVANGTIAIADATGTIIDDDAIANLAISQTLPLTNAYVGYPFTVLLSVTNQGPYAATNVLVTQVLPAGFTFVSGAFNSGTGTVVEATGTITASVPVLTNGGSFEVALVVTASAAGDATFEAAVSSSQFDNDTADNVVSGTKSVVAPIVAVAKAGSLLVQESFNPANRGIDPGETVVVTFKLKNTGNIASTNIIAMLRSATGITTGEPAKSYGVIPPDGSSVGRDFVFIAQGTGASTVTATLDVYDVTPNGSNSLGTVSFDYQLGESGTYESATPVTIPTIGQASVYPTTVNISGLQGRISKLTVKLTGLSHTFPDDLDILLVSPSGKGIVLMSDAGGSADLVAVDLTFDDAAAGTLPDANKINSGTYRPTNYGADDTFTGAPAGPYATELASFIGSTPNGDWQLYIVDDGAGDGGSLAGWSLNIQTTIPADPVAELAVSGSVNPNPTFVGQNYTYSLTVTNMGPATANNLRLTSTLPDGVSIITSIPGVSTSAGNFLSFNLGTLAAGSSTTVTLQVTSTSAGSLTNIVAVVADEIDLQAQNSTVALVTRVNRVAMLSGLSNALPNGQFGLNITGQAGLTYVVEVSTNLVNWTPVYTNTTLDGSVSFTDTNAANTGLRFYRALER